MKELDELITYIENDLIGEHKYIEIIDEAIKKYAELYHKKQLLLCGVNQKRKLLLDFLSKVNGNLIAHPHLQMNTDFVDEYIKSNNWL